jgi:hypothetical protein
MLVKALDGTNNLMKLGGSLPFLGRNSTNIEKTCYKTGYMDYPEENELKVRNISSFITSLFFQFLWNVD